MQTHRIRTGRFVLIPLLPAAPVIAAEHAADKKGIVRSDARKEQLDLVNELYGKDITVPDSLGQVHPEHPAGVPGSVRRITARKKMNWWGKEPVSSHVTQERSSRTGPATAEVTAEGYRKDWRTIVYDVIQMASKIPGRSMLKRFWLTRTSDRPVHPHLKPFRTNFGNVRHRRTRHVPITAISSVHAWGYIPVPHHTGDSDETAGFQFPLGWWVT